MRISNDVSRRAYYICDIAVRFEAGKQHGQDHGDGGHEYQAILYEHKSLPLVASPLLTDFLCHLLFICLQPSNHPSFRLPAEIS